MSFLTRACALVALVALTVATTGADAKPSKNMTGAFQPRIGADRDALLRGRVANPARNAGRLTRFPHDPSGRDTALRLRPREPTADSL